MAFQNHHDTLSFFPCGGNTWSTPPNFVNGQPATGQAQNAGWGFQILPFIEAQNTYKSSVKVIVGTTNKVFFCPSRRGPQTVSYSDGYTGNPQPTTHALCDYAASNTENTGIVRRNNVAPVVMTQIKDGTSNTLMVGDKRLNLKNLGKAQSDDNEGYSCGWDHDTMRHSNVQPAQDANSTGGTEFGSSHIGKFNAVFADGSVRNVSYSVSLPVFTNLCNINDGNPISEGSY